jgi:DNA-binding response OmpR family regulator
MTPSRRVRILVVDDDERFRLMLRAILSETGMEVTEAASGEDALGLLARSDPDVVVIDWRMPGGGLSLARKLITEHGLRNRVIMLTGLDDPRDRRAAHKAGVAEYLIKPPKRDELIGAICEAVRREG